MFHIRKRHSNKLKRSKKPRMIFFFGSSKQANSNPSWWVFFLLFLRVKCIRMSFPSWKKPDFNGNKAVSIGLICIIYWKCVVLLIGFKLRFLDGENQDGHRAQRIIIDIKPASYFCRFLLWTIRTVTIKKPYVLWLPK